MSSASCSASGEENPGIPGSLGSAAGDRRDDVDARTVGDRRVELGGVLVDEDEDVAPQLRPGLADPVAQAGPAVVERREGLADGRAAGLLDLVEAGEQR